MNIVLPEYVEDILKRLEGQGFSAYVVGGCVRDALLGKAPGDWDIATGATPEEMLRCFAGLRVLPTGIRHGTLTVFVGEESCEVTTYRVDGAYSDHRRPDSIAFTSRIEEDLARRDFTINAMAWNRRRGLINPFGGEGDLRAGRIACVGKPEARFAEDALRILRALRFACTLDFTVEESTAAAMFRGRALLDNVARERVFAELCKSLVGPGCKRALDRHAGVLLQVIPELAPMVGFEQRNPHHHLDVWQHTLEALSQSPPVLPVRFALLLHDIAKPACFTLDEKQVGHFKGHPGLGAEIAARILTGLRAPGNFTRRVERLILHHDDDIPAEPKAVRRWLAALGEEELRMLLAMRTADTMAKSPAYREGRLRALDAAEVMLGDIAAQGCCVCLRDLAVNGRDLLALGVPEGKEIGRILSGLLARVIDGQLENEREALLAEARACLKRM